MTDRLVNPDAIPIPGIAAEELRKTAGEIKSVVDDISSVGHEISNSWQGLSESYTAPEAGDLIEKIDMVPEKGDDFKEVATSVANALIEYADKAEELKSKLLSLQSEGRNFLASIEGDDDWADDDDKREDNNDLVDRINNAVIALQEAERECANKITSLFPGGTTFVPDTGEYLPEGHQAYGMEEVPEGATMPWGGEVPEDEYWFVDLAKGAGMAMFEQTVFAMVPTALDMAGIYNSEEGLFFTDSWSDWWDNATGIADEQAQGMFALFGYQKVYGTEWSVFGEWEHVGGEVAKPAWKGFFGGFVAASEFADRPAYSVGTGAVNAGVAVAGAAGVARGLQGALTGVRNAKVPRVPHGPDHGGGEAGGEIPSNSTHRGGAGGSTGSGSPGESGEGADYSYEIETKAEGDNWWGGDWASTTPEGTGGQIPQAAETPNQAPQTESGAGVPDSTVGGDSARAGSETPGAGDSTGSHDAEAPQQSPGAAEAPSEHSDQGPVEADPERLTDTRDARPEASQSDSEAATSEGAETDSAVPSATGERTTDEPEAPTESSQETHTDVSHNEGAEGAQSKQDSDAQVATDQKADAAEAQEIKPDDTASVQEVDRIEEIAEANGGNYEEAIKQAIREKKELEAEYRELVDQHAPENAVASSGDQVLTGTRIGGESGSGDLTVSAVTESGEAGRAGVGRGATGPAPHGPGDHHQPPSDLNTGVHPEGRSGGGAAAGGAQDGPTGRLGNGAISGDGAARPSTSPPLEPGRPRAHYNDTVSVDSKSPLVPSAGQRFGDGQDLNPNTRYEVVDRDGNDRGEFITDGSGRIVEVVTKSGSSKGVNGPNVELRYPRPDTVYRVDTFAFHTDEKGRTALVEGELRLEDGERDASSQRRVNEEGHKDYEEFYSPQNDEMLKLAQATRSPSLTLDDIIHFHEVGWDAGHLIARMFGGPPEYVNLTAMTEYVNRKIYRPDGSPATLDDSFGALEDHLKAQLSATPPKSVSIRISLLHEEDMRSPTELFVEYWIDGQYHSAQYDNMPPLG